MRSIPPPPRARSRQPSSSSPTRRCRDSGLALDLDPARRRTRRPARSSSSPSPGSRQPADPQLHGQRLRRRESRRSDGQPTRSRQRVRSRRSDALVVFIAAEPAQPIDPSRRCSDCVAPHRKTATGRSSARGCPLDEDVATRSAGLGRVHNELGFGRLALLDAWQAIGDDPTNFAAHRLLADGYSTEPRHEIARVSELLHVAAAAARQRHADQAAARAAESVHRATRGPEPRVVRRARFTDHHERAQAPRFGRRRRQRHAGRRRSPGGAAGSSVIQRGHYRFATDGFRDNNELEQEVANAFLQFRPSLRHEPARPSCGPRAPSTAI